MEIKGQIKRISDTQRVSDRFQKREFVVTTEANTPYPQHVEFVATQDNCDKLNAFKVGQDVQVHFNLRGREWSGPQGVKYFNTLECWRLVSLQDEHHAASQASQNHISDNNEFEPPF